MFYFLLRMFRCSIPLNLSTVFSLSLTGAEGFIAVILKRYTIQIPLKYYVLNLNDQGDKILLHFLQTI